MYHFLNGYQHAVANHFEFVPWSYQLHPKPNISNILKKIQV